MKKRIALLLAMALLVTGVVGCHTEDMQGTEAGQVIYQTVDIADAVAHKDDTSVYEYIGKHITIDMVQEDPETGLAYVTYENTTYELGMDFLSKAMVYNCAVPKDAPQYNSQKEVHQQWWKLYIQRWNYLVPEIPLYSKQDRYLYNTKLENFQPTAYQGAAEAILCANVKNGYANSASVGSTAALSGTFRDIYNAHAADGEIAKLTGGYNLVKAEKNGELVWNMAALESMPQVVKNVDGTVTYTMHLRKNLRFSDGTSITARDYLAPLLVHCGIMGDTAVGETLVGYKEYHVYDGTNHGQNVSVQNQNGKEETVKASKSLSGLKLLGEFSFSVTLVKAYVDHYYALTQMQFAPAPAQMYIGNSDVLLESGGRAYLSQDFYAKTQQDDYVMADILQQNLQWDSQFA